MACEYCESKDAVKKCARCLLVYYCGVNCQRADWEKHRMSCIATDRYLLLHRVCKEKGVAWSAEVFPLYQAWDHGKTGSRWKKMVEFVATL